MRGAGTYGLAGGEAQGRHVRVGEDPRALVPHRVAEVCHRDDATGQRGRHAWRRFRRRGRRLPASGPGGKRKSHPSGTPSDSPGIDGSGKRDGIAGGVILVRPCKHRYVFVYSNYNSQMVLTGGLFVR
ncbi:hypothetical protein DESC_720373 [Desulfosarcina cetonica]|nr:hypothetical protein DESC_720373 [Desulfosarcina cetonica]